MTTLPFRFGAGALLCLAAAASAAPAPEPVRAIEVDVARAAAPIDRAFDLSVGSDFAGTLIRPDSLAQLDTAVRELGFRYVRFHDIFTDALGTVKMRDGRIVYDWTKIDQLYDALLARKIKPFVELGFTPDALKTSDQTIFYWKGNTSHPQAEGWAGLIDAYVRHLRQRYGAEEVRSWYFEVWNEPNLAGFWEKARQGGVSQPVRIDRADDQGDRPGIARRRAGDGGRGVGARPARLCRGAYRCRSISSRRTPMASTAVSSTRRARTTIACRPIARCDRRRRPPRPRADRGVEIPRPAAVLHRMERELQSARSGARFLCQRALYPDQAASHARASRRG